MRSSVLIVGRRIPFGLIGMLGLIAAAESYLASHEIDLAPNSASYEWRMVRKAIPGRIRDSDLLCFGDSLMKMGLSPILLEQRLGLRTYNLAISGGRSPSSYFLLRQAIESGIRPRAVLVDFKWSALDSSILDRARVLPEIGGLREHVELSMAFRSARLFADLMVAEALPSYRRRLDLRQGLLAAINGTRVPNRLDVLPWLRTWFRNRGAHHTAEIPAFGGTIDVTNKDVFQTKWKCQLVNADYVDRFLKLAGENEIPVFWLVMPVSPSAQAWREKNGVDASYSAFIHSVQERFPGVVVIDARQSGYSTAEFYDATHLNRRGTAGFSIEVARLLRRRFSAEPEPARWVTLPAFRAPPTVASIEDVEQSIVAVHQADRSLRR